MRFVIDAQLPPALARLLSSRGYDVTDHLDSYWKYQQAGIIELV